MTASLTGFALSPQQRRCWLLAQRGELGSFRLLLAGEEDGEALERTLGRALARLADAHDILRIVPREIPGHRFPLLTLEETVAPGSQAGSPAAGGPPWSVSVEREEGGVATGTRIVLTFHPLLVDLPSLALLAEELTTASRGGAAEAREEEVGYLQFTAWLEEELAAEEAEESRAYWRARPPVEDLSLPLPGPLPLPPSAPASAAREADEAEILLDPTLLSAAARSFGGGAAQLRVLLIAAWSAFLARIAQAESGRLAVLADGREFEELARVVGPCARHLPLTFRLPAGRSFAAHHAEVEAELAAGEEHQRVFDPGEASLGGLPPHAFELQELPAVAGAVGLRVVGVEAPAGDFSSRLLCLLRVPPADGAGAEAVAGPEARLRLGLHPGAHDPAAAATLLEAFHAFLAGLLEGGSEGAVDPRRIPLLAEVAEVAEGSGLAGRHASFDPSFDIGFAEREPWRPVQHCIAAHAAERPEAPALLMGGATGATGRALTYGELDRAARRVAAGLGREAGRGTGARASKAGGLTVGIALPPSPELVIALLGVLYAGGTYVPLDPEAPPRRLARMLEDAGCDLLLTQPEVEARLEGRYPGPIHSTISDLEAAVGDGGLVLDPVPSPEQLAYILFTSGSTGHPKGVGVTHRNLAHYLRHVNERWVPALGGGAVCWPWTSRITFDASLKQLWGPLARGERVWIAPPELAADPPALLDALAALEAVVFNGVPSLWRALLTELRQRGPEGEGRAKGQAVPRFAAVMLGGEALTSDLLAATRDLLPGVPVWNLYGPTETTANAIAGRQGDGERPHLGAPVAGARIYLADRALQPVPDYLPGEICIGGSAVARGYVGRRRETAASFVPDPFASAVGQRLYHTGDRARWRPTSGPEGRERRLEYLGRADGQVKIRGFRVELGEVEARLRALPGVADAAVLLRAGAPGGPQLVAFYQPSAAPSGAEEPSALREGLRRHLPDYMLPALLLRRDRLPRLASGKVDRRKLAEAPLEVDSRPYVAPRDAIEERLAEIWQRVLGRARIGVEEDFFELGGHSIQSVQIVHEARLEGHALTPRELMLHPTIAELAEVLRRAAGAQSESGGEDAAEWEEGAI